MPRILKFTDGVLTKAETSDGNVVAIPDDFPKDDFETVATNNVDKADDDGFVELVSTQMKAEKEARHLLENAEKEAKAKADEIINQAQAKAYKIISEAEESAALVKAQAKTEGYENAYNQLAPDIVKTLTALSEIIERVDNENAEFIRAYSESVGSLALEMASEILKQKLDNDPLIMCDMIEFAVNSVKNAEQATVEISTEMIPLLEFLQSELSERCPTIKRLDVVGADIPPDSCMINSSSGSIDISIPQQIENLKKRLDQLKDRIID